MSLGGFAWLATEMVQLVRNLMAHGDAREGKWRGNWRMEWVASTLTLPPNMAYPALLKLMRTPRLPAVDWTDTHTDLNGLVRFEERRNLVSALVPSRSAIHIKSILLLKCCSGCKYNSKFKSPVLVCLVYWLVVSIADEKCSHFETLGV